MAGTRDQKERTYLARGNLLGVQFIDYPNCSTPSHFVPAIFQKGSISECGCGIDQII